MATSENHKLWIQKSAVLLACIAAYYWFPGVRDFVTTSSTHLHNRDFDNLRQFILSYGLWAPITSIAIMILQSLVPLVPGLVITITNAWIFGWECGALYSWIGALTGAVLDFGIARWYGRPVAEKLVKPKYLSLTDTFFARYGVTAVFITRLTPIVPFKVVSYGAGLTAIPLKKYLLATGVGQTPAIVLYSVLGQNLIESSRTILLVTSLLLVLGVLAYYCRDIIERRFSSKKD